MIQRTLHLTYKAARRVVIAVVGATGGLADVGELPEEIRRQQELAQQAAEAASAEAEAAAEAELQAVREAEPPSERG